jgi:hypothetical protein
MSNRTTVPAIPDYDAMEVELVPVTNEFDIGAILARTGEMLEHLTDANGSRFPWGARSNIAYEKELEGRAFLFVSAPLPAEVEDAFNKGQTKNIMRALVRFYVPATGELMPPREARFQGGYTVSQLRALTERDLVGSYLWTLARDEDESPYQRGDGWEYPRKLAIWNPETDAPVEPRYDMSWSESIEATARKVAELADQGTTILPTRGVEKIARK